MTDNFNLPLLKKSGELYKIFYSCRANISKQDRHSIWQRCEDLILDIYETVFMAIQAAKLGKTALVEKANAKLNLLRFLVRLCREVKIIDSKKYINLEKLIDEIGRMLGGWARSLKQ